MNSIKSREITPIELEYLLDTGKWQNFGFIMFPKDNQPLCPVCKYPETYVCDYFTHTTEHHKISYTKAFTKLRDHFKYVEDPKPDPFNTWISNPINYASLFLGSHPPSREERIKKAETELRILEIKITRLRDEINCIRNND